ncbi:MAG: hypothetical protein DI533_08210 [Cereibacter sphaeroides]|uniref:Uncharacterized protein n=1 Tax=Cereibacter sphaeroides TaxID=1063 RepID=A0A2W5TWN0_CERSP|nr:MAG: hypothetical protein DI533_08210 [Cereibacter sphaeroides]
MYLGPLLIGTATGYFHAFVALFLSGSFLTAFLTLMISGISITLLLLVTLVIRSEAASRKPHGSSHGPAQFQPVSP